MNTAKAEVAAIKARREMCKVMKASGVRMKELIEGLREEREELLKRPISVSHD